MKLVMRTRRGEDREDKTVVVFNGPPAVRGTAFLQFDHRDRDAEQWLYLPELRRVRKITSSSKNDKFMGTDFSYRDLEARKIGRDSALETWRRVRALVRAGGTGGEASAEAQARSQYYLFRAQVETALTNLFRVENRLRYLMGLPMSDGRLIRPIDEPTTAQVAFDWPTIHAEALTNRTELRRQKWQIKRRELELIAAKNQLLPRLDAVGRYRWLGAGDELLFVGTPDARSELKLMLSHEHVLAYVLTGREQTGGWVWEKLARRKEAKALRATAAAPR